MDSNLSLEDIQLLWRKTKYNNDLKEDYEKLHQIKEINALLKENTIKISIDIDLIENIGRVLCLMYDNCSN